MQDCESLIESFTVNHPESFNIEMPNSVVEAFSMYEDLLHMDYGSKNTDIISYNYYCHKIYERAMQLYDEESKFEWPYSVSPYFVEDEITDLQGYYAEDAEISRYAQASGGRTLHQRIIDLRDELKNTNDPDEITRIKGDLQSLGVEDIDDAMNEYATGSEHDRHHFEPISWDKKIRTLMTQLKGTDDPDEIAVIKQQIVDLGWNPEVEYTSENKVLAKKRYESLLQERYGAQPPMNIQWLIETYNENEVISETTERKDIVKPIHIILTNESSAICIDNDFTQLYLYDTFALESINKYNQNDKFDVFTFFVKEEDWKVIKERCEYLSDTSNTNYNIVNALTESFKQIDFDKPKTMICSQFVDSILKMAHNDPTRRFSIAVREMKVSTSNGKIYKTFDGIIKDFNTIKTQKYIDNMSKKAKPFTESINWITNLLEDYIYPVVCEARPVIDVNDKGDILITNPNVNFDAEYSASHKLLMQYEKAKNLEGMKYELARLFYMNYILEKRLHSAKYSKDKDKNTKTRARVLNDFNKYMKFLLKYEPQFNFAEYYEKSIFYPYTVTIKKNLLVKIKEILGDII